jgi:hypothetical protein
LDEVPLDSFQLALLALEVIAQRVTVLVEQVRVHPDHRLAVARVHSHLVIADAAGQPQPLDRHARRAHVDRHLAAQVQPGLGLLLPRVGQERLAVPFLQHEPDVDVLLQAAHPELLAAGRDQRADWEQRTAGRVRGHLRVMDAEHAAVRKDRHDELQ